MFSLILIVFAIIVIAVVHMILKTLLYESKFTGRFEVERLHEIARNIGASKSPNEMFRMAREQLERIYGSNYLCCSRDFAQWKSVNGMLVAPLHMSFSESISLVGCPQPFTLKSCGPAPVECFNFLIDGELLAQHNGRPEVETKRAGDVFYAHSMMTHHISSRNYVWSVQYNRGLVWLWKPFHIIVTQINDPWDIVRGFVSYYGCSVFQLVRNMKF